MTTTARIRITRMTNADELIVQIAPKMRNLGQAIGVRMQRLVPKKSWALHDSIETDTDINTSSGVITTQIGVGNERVRYGLFVERGTSRMRAQPYMRPALAQSKSADLNFSGHIANHGIITSSRVRRRTRGA